MAPAELIYDCIENGLLRARNELGLTSDVEIAPAEVSVVWKYTLVEWLSERWGGVEAIRHALRTGELTRDALCESVETWLPALKVAWHGAPVPEHLHRRIIDLAVDAVQSERLAPELLLSPTPVTLPDIPIHALVFSVFPHITHDLYPLMVDAYVANGGGQVIGVHESWLTGGSFHRAILFQEDNQGLIEADILGQPRIASAFVLALDLRQEHATHQRIEQALPGVHLRNPYAGARQLDDKAWTGQVWQRAGLVTPDFRLLPKGTAAEEILPALIEFTVQHRSIVLKPAHGTEGRDIAVIDMGAPAAINSAGEMIRQILSTDAVLLTVRRGTVCYRAAASPLPFAIRLNVSWDGTCARAESGYAQVAPAPEMIASAGRGGALIPLSELWANLAQSDGTPLTPTADDWQQLLSTAQAGVTALGEVLGALMPALVGIDLLLEVNTAGHLLPVLLEANPRPAGLGHARLIDRHGPTSEPGISLHLWDSPITLQE